MNNECIKDTKKKTKVVLNHNILSEYIKDIRNRLDDYVVGQDKAKDEVCASLTRTLIDNPKREKPIGSFMFLGPSGVGKTELVRALFRILFNDDSIQIDENTIDCSTMKEKHFLTSLIGSPPSYVGGEKVPLLADTNLFKHFRKAQAENRLHPILEGFDDFSILLLDEIEKSHPNFSEMFLGIMDKGKFTLNTGNTEEQKFNGINHSKITKFKNVLIIMTSNLGAKDLSDKASGRDGVMGFNPNKSKEVIIADDFYDDAVQDRFLNEFRTRLTAEIGFDFLSRKEYFTILEMQITNHNKYFEHFEIELILSKKIKSYLVNNALNENIGGRLIVNNFETLIETNFARVLNNGQIEFNEGKYNDTIESLYFDLDDEDKLVVYGIFSSDSKSNKKANKRKRKELFKRKRKLLSDEVTVSLYSGSMLLTLRNNILPTVSALRALYMHKENLSKTFEEDIAKYELQLKSWGLTDKDFTLMKADIITEKFNDFNAFFVDTEGIRLWSDEQFDSTFNGNLRYVEKYITHYFKENSDAKSLIESGAGGIDDILMPINIFIIDMLSRDLTLEEENLIRYIFHREYVKLHEKLPHEQLPAPKKKKKEFTPKSKIVKSSAKSTDSAVVININFGDKEKKKKKSYKQRLKNLFGKDFDQLLLLIKKNIEIDDDIISILVEVREQLGLDITSKQNAAIFHAINKKIKQKKKKEK